MTPTIRQRIIDWLHRNVGTTLLFIAGALTLLSILLIDPYALHESIPAILVGGMAVAVTLVSMEGYTKRAVRLAVAAERERHQAATVELIEALRATREEVRKRETLVERMMIASADVELDEVALDALEAARARAQHPAGGAWRGEDDLGPWPSDHCID